MEKTLAFLTGIILIICGFVLDKIIVLSISRVFLFILSLVFYFCGEHWHIRSIDPAKVFLGHPIF
ncbi:MAG: hypothetical protein Q4D77_05750 [Peptostreptococcaceae bacterium]|nr:hypothetical protein [Peptostreptococcaceae bacterium]